MQYEAFAEQEYELNLANDHERIIFAAIVHIKQ